jgi:DNA helicase HerA-like ATPase
MLLNTSELVSFAHLPSASVRTEKLTREIKRSKPAPSIARGHELALGENIHKGKTTTITLSPVERLRHTYVIGATGTGKSTLLLNMIVQDIEHGVGLAVLDPQGDLIERILERVPDWRFTTWFCAIRQIRNGPLASTFSPLTQKLKRIFSPPT